MAISIEQLKKIVISNEVEFTNRMYINDPVFSEDELAEEIKLITEEINSCISLDDLLCYYFSRGYTMTGACEVIIDTLLDKGFVSESLEG
jgi:hypothetical protein